GTFNALEKAPLVEDDYRGPVLFSADASTSLFERLIVPNILGIRPDLGNPARTNGEFASYYKSPVLPAMFTVFDDLKKQLIEMCKDQGRPYGYYVETTGPQLSPRLLWRVYVNDGHMELVRGAVFKQLDTRALRSDIVAAGNDVYVYNRAEPLPSAIVAPSVLFGELEIQRANRTREKLPEYPAPALGTATAAK